MNQWTCLAEIPAEIRQTMAVTFIAWEKQDLGIESVLDLMIQNPRITHQVCQTVQTSFNAVRVPELCRVVHTAHSQQSWRDVFCAVALFTGMHCKHVQRLYYTERRAHV